jgi:DNA-directed RNA polymerase subunit RPC12/RpoP
MLTEQQLMQSPTNFYQCPKCGAEFGRPAFVQCAGANYEGQSLKALSCAACGELITLSALPVVRVEPPPLLDVDPATVPEFLRPITGS